MDAKSDQGVGDDLAGRWRAELEASLPAAIALRREIHAEPDISGLEEPTSQRFLRALGNPPAEVVADTGRLVRFGPPGPSIGLRAELDALPITEISGAPYASTRPAMHACGHDVHLAALFAVLNSARELDLPLGLLGVLQPREETGATGAGDIVAGNHLIDHELRALVAAHVQPQVPAGQVASEGGPVNASVDEIDIVVSGKGGHGAYPHLAVDPVPVLCRIVLALQEAARSTVNPLHAAVVSITQLQGSAATNVIPGTATGAGTVRVMQASDRTLLHERLARTVTSIAEAHGCTAKYEIRRGSPALVNDQRLAFGTRAWLDDFGFPAASFASCGSDDFANYGVQLPILMQFVGTGSPAGNPEMSGPMLHDPAFLPGDHVVQEVALALLAGYLGAVSSAF
ncbi:M20 metallopeptidase family protein [Kineosporia babensis]|uniref:M20 family metallopeptidase n=1 Tax=Kineosporia babensis TaxID=499548 RepID=A0A9X1NMU7_9ACTN|nr:M20 family metallopeptidase [Kineosporia babensis]MCD5317078.1 M20 family metallopeptidase [Kineosporia babensis]